VPASMIYQFFFLHVANLEQVAQTEHQKGNEKRAGRWRTYDQRAAGLNATEGRLVKQLALDCNKELKDQSQKLQTLVNDFHAQHPNGEFAKLPVPQEVVDMTEQGPRTIDSYIDRLRLELGEEPFKKLDSYVRTSFRPVSVQIPSQLFASSPVAAQGDNRQ